jgi:hypothetical protein
MRAVSPRGSPYPNPLFGYGEIDGGALPVVRARGYEPPPELDGSVAVPQEFGGSVSFRALDTLRKMINESHDGLSIRIVTGRDVYRIGDSLRMGIFATDDCSCLAFVRDAEGSYALLPAETSGTLVLERGKTRLLPQAENESLDVQGPPGTDELLLVCSLRPVILETAGSVTNAGVAVAGHSYLIVEDQQ